MAGPSLIAQYGKTWSSPRWAVVINGMDVDASAWSIIAQARENADAADAVFVFSVAAGTVVLDTAEIELRDGTMLETSTVQLILRPSDWTGKPRRWRGVLEVDIASDASSTPNYLYSIVAGRTLEVITGPVR